MTLLLVAWVLTSFGVLTLFVGVGYEFSVASAAALLWPFCLGLVLLAIALFFVVVCLYVVCYAPVSFVRACRGRPEGSNES